MVQIYWEIGQQLDKACDGKQAEYGKGVLQQVSDKLTAEFGKGYSYANLRNMRQFYRCFPNCYALRSNLSWTHYRMLMRVADSKAREFYAADGGAGWGADVVLEHARVLAGGELQFSQPRIIWEISR